MKKTFTLFLFIATSTLSFSQAMMHKNWWQMGNLAGCQFNSGSPVGIGSSLVNVNEGSISMSDKTTGALLFYTEGMTVWNAANGVMPNGTGLMGNPSSTQSGMVVPRPGSTTQYYVFTVFPGSGLRYSIVDMTLNAGMGDVTATKNVLLGGTNVDEKLTGCLHFNGIDYWVTIHVGASNQFISYLVTAAGIGAGVVSNVGPILNGAIGYMNMSSCGNWIGLSNYNPSLGVASFNNSTGVVSNYIDLNSGSNYSSGFSPDGTKFYHWSYTPTNAIYEVDLNAGTQAAINASRVQIAIEPNWFGAFVFGRDGKLYIPSYNTPNMHVINNPNLMGAAVGYVSNAINVVGNSQLGLPNFIEISACPVPLPIDLIYFNANCKDGKTNIEWATSNERNNDHFEIERSADGINFVAVGRVEKVSVVTAKNKYSFVDENAILGIGYYRLKQVDKDATAKHFEPVAVSCKLKKEIQAFPNPTTGVFKIDGIVGENEVTISDMLGRIVYHEENLVDITEIDLNELKNGIYFIEIDLKGQERLLKKVTLNR